MMVRGIYWYIPRYEQSSHVASFIVEDLATEVVSAKDGDGNQILF